MPKHLLLLRHAESVEKMQGQQDSDRELTSNGMRQAVRIGSFIYQEKIAIDCIYSSTAVRALKTTEMVMDAMKLPTERMVSTEELYDASTRTLFSFVTSIDDDFNTVLCVAHNPPASYLAEYLTKAEIGDMVPAGLAIIFFNVARWKELSEGGGELVRYVYPEMLDE